MHDQHNFIDNPSPLRCGGLSEDSLHRQRSFRTMLFGGLLLNAILINAMLIKAVVGSIAVALVLTLSLSSDASAQLPRDLRDQFEHLIPDLEPDLRLRFQNAIDDETSTVVFTPEEFKRFRDDPINPFEDLLKINPPDDSGDISLKFELPSLRNRPVAAEERQASGLLNQVSNTADAVYPSVVSFWKDDRNVALGIVVGKNGYIVTKASEVQKRSPVICLIDGEDFPAELIRVDPTNDVALMKVDAKNLVPIQWNRQPTIVAGEPDRTSSMMPDGSFVLTPGDEQSVLAIGTLSVQPRSTAAGEQAFLGVNPQRVQGGVRITDVHPGEASHDAGLIDGDVITELGGQKIADVDDLVASIRSHRPGDSVAIGYLRQGQRRSTRATLAGRNMPAQQAAHFKMMNRLGAILSKRNDNFPVVFQHDTPLFPEQCGGPIIDLSGHVIGMNIARQGRAASLAIPAANMQTIVDDLMRQSVAAFR